MAPRYRVTLTEQERKDLEALTSSLSRINNGLYAQGISGISPPKRLGMLIVLPDIFHHALNQLFAGIEYPILQEPFG